MKIFAIIRDGNTFTAKQRGILKGTNYIEVKKLDDDYVNNFFSEKREQLLTALNNYSKIANINLDYDPVALKECKPKKCTSKESWDFRRCEGYCPVSEICGSI